MHAEADYSRMWVALYEDIVQNGRVTRYAGYPVLVNGRHIMAPTPIPRWDVPRLHMAPHLTLFGAGREKRVYAVLPLTKVVPLASRITRSASRTSAVARAFGAAARRPTWRRRRMNVAKPSTSAPTPTGATPRWRRTGPTVSLALRVEMLTKLYGAGCLDCVRLTGPELETNTCLIVGPLSPSAEVGFDFRPGRAIGIVGESGSGKTTVLRCLYGDIRPSTGEASLGGFDDGQSSDVFDADPQQRRRIRNFLTGMVYQHPRQGLNLLISAGGNVAERLLAAEWRRVDAIRDRAGHLLGRMEIPLGRMDEIPGPLQRRHAAAGPGGQSAGQWPERGPAGRDDVWLGRFGPGGCARPGSGASTGRWCGHGRRLARPGRGAAVVRAHAGHE